MHDTFVLEQNPTRKSRTRTAVSRRVYGKRKVDAPRAVLEKDNPNLQLYESTACLSNSEVEGLVSAIEKDVAGLKLEDQECEVSSRIQEKKKTLEEDDGSGGTGTERQQFERHNSNPKEIQRVEVRMGQRDKKKENQSVEKNDEEGPSSLLRSEKKSKRKQLPRKSYDCVEDVKTKSYVQPILEEAMSPIASRGVQKFDNWAQRAGHLFVVEKIAEGSYGEVYQLRFKENTAGTHISQSRLARLKAYNDGVFKIVPLRAQHGAGSKKHTTVQEIVSEVQLLKLLDVIPGFARFREVHVVQGRFPQQYQEAWINYTKTHDDSINPDPSKKKSYPDTQLWAILEMDNAGHELEKFAWSSVFQVYDIFWGVAMALARAEQFASFEVCLYTCTAYFELCANILSLAS